MDTLIRLPIKDMMDAVYRRLDYSSFTEHDKEILVKYASLDEKQKNAVDNLVSNMTQHKEHMGYNFRQVLEQFKNTATPISLRMFSKFLDAFDDDIMQNTSAKSGDIDYIERGYDLHNLFQLKKMQPYFRADKDKLSKEKNEKKNAKYVFMEIICLYLGIDLSVIFYGKGKTYDILNIENNNPEALIYNWQDLAEECDKQFKLSLDLNRKIDIYSFPLVDFQKVYKETFGVAARESYTVVRSIGSPALLSDLQAKAVAKLISDLSEDFQS